MARMADSRTPIWQLRLGGCFAGQLQGGVLSSLTRLLRLGRWLGRSAGSIRPDQSLKRWPVAK
jgi:hypothetical protein